MANNTIASESGHFYWPDGTPCYTLIGKNGNERPTTVRDAKNLGLSPSVTEVLKTLPKPFLTSWKQKQVLYSALTLTRAENEPDDDFIARIMADSEEQARKAAEKGKAIHGAIERYITSGTIKVDDEYWNYIFGVVYVLNEIKVAISDFVAEKSFASLLGYGGKVDLHSKKENIVIDFKTKEFSKDYQGRLAWDEHIIQLIAYAHGLCMPDARLINVYISTSVPGLVRIVEHNNVDRDYYWQVFQNCLKLYKTLKKL